jgi:hypothetical protein
VRRSNVKGWPSALSVRVPRVIGGVNRLAVVEDEYVLLETSVGAPELLAEAALRAARA